MATNPKLQEISAPSLKPLPAVSPEKYARVRFRIKGNIDGPTYQGQELVRKCKSCGGK